MLYLVSLGLIDRTPSEAAAEPPAAMLKLLAGTVLFLVVAAIRWSDAQALNAAPTGLLSRDVFVHLYNYLML